MTKDNTCQFDRVGLNDMFDKSKQKGYAEMIHCNNCNWFETVYIPFGKTIKEYLKTKSCPRCNCSGVLY